MKQYTKFCLIFWLFPFIIHHAAAQSGELPSQEGKMVKLYEKVLEARSGNSDSVEYFSDKFGKAFKNLVKTNPGTLNYSFKRLKDSNYCFVATSADGNFRIYSWDTWTGGTMHNFDAILQWKSNGKVFTKKPRWDEGDAGSFVADIFTVNIGTKTYYLPVWNGIFSTKDAGQSISVLTIENNQLVDTVKLFKTKTKLLNSIDVEYDFFSVVDRPERPVRLITYDDKQKILYIPVVGDKGEVTNRNILYQLKDKYFEFIGVETGKRK